MEQEFRKLSVFLQHTTCLFQIDSLDYPNFIQQQFINSYFFLSNIMQKQHNQIVRQLHSSNDKILQTISQGFLYCSLINQQKFQQLVQYMIILRIQIWSMITKNFRILLDDCLDSIKAEYRSNFNKIQNLLITYSSPDPELCRLLIKSINQHEKNIHIIASNKKILQTLLQYIRSMQSIKDEQFSKILHQQLFLKCLRLLKNSPYYQICSDIIQNLWNKDCDKCSQFLIDNIFVIQNGIQYSKPPLIEKIYNSSKAQFDIHKQQYMNREMVYGALLPKRVETLMQYLLIADNLPNCNLRIQLTWLQKQWTSKQLNLTSLLIDIAVWVSLSYDNLNRRVFILDWAIRKTYNANPNAYRIIRKSIFERWFRDNQHPEYYRVSLQLLRHMIYNDHRIANEMFTSILQQNEKYWGNFRNIFQLAHKNGYLKLEEINRNQMLTVGIKQALKNVMENYQPNQQNAVDPRLSLYSQPIIIRQKSESFDQINYDSPKRRVYDKIGETRYVLNIEQEYVTGMGTDLTDVLDNPQMQNYNKFFKKACQMGVSARKQQNNQQITNMICQQTAKVLYIMFNREFQTFTTITGKQNSILYKLLTFIVNQWHRVTHKLQVVKLIIKFIMQLFPSAQPAVWKYYFTYFQFGGTNNRSIKNWLVAAEHQKLVIPILQELSQKLDENLKKNLLRYGFNYA